LARGKLQVIRASAISEYRMYIEKDAALEPRLSLLTLLGEPGPIVQLDDMFERDDDFDARSDTAILFREIQILYTSHRK